MQIKEKRINKYIIMISERRDKRMTAEEGDNIIEEERNKTKDLFRRRIKGWLLLTNMVPSEMVRILIKLVLKYQRM